MTNVCVNLCTWGAVLRAQRKKKAGVGVCVFMCLEEVVLEFQLPTLPVPFLLFTF